MGFLQKNLGGIGSAAEVNNALWYSHSIPQAAGQTSAGGEEPELGRRFTHWPRFMPRMLTKKLERMVWKPSAASVTPGITQRIV